MMMQSFFTIDTPGRQLIDITSRIADFVHQANIKTGLCNVFLHHTSASLIICENDDITVQNDLESFMRRLAPDELNHYEHTIEGEDDMPSHIRSVLTANSISFPVTDFKLALGTWQGIYLWEHRFKSHHRKITMTLIS